MTVAQALLAAARTIEASGHAAAPRREAEEILGALLGRERSYLIAHGDERLDAGSVAVLDAHIARRAGGEPVALVTGQADFCGRPFAVTRATLIPRPETELIVERARPLAPRHILDVGTGTGCLAITLALEHRGARVVGSDISRDALDVARANAGRHRVAACFVRGDGLGCFAGASFDLIVANPPYVDHDDRLALPVEVRDHEPPLALYSAQGIDHLSRWIPGASRCLARGGRLLFEIGYGQSDVVRAIAAAAPLRDVTIHDDFAHIPRVLEARRA